LFRADPPVYGGCAFNYRRESDVNDPLATVALVTPFGSVRNDVRIRRSAREVWAVIADVASVADWFPSFQSSRVEGTQRIVVTGTGISLVEDILRVDHEQRRFQYAIVPNGAIREHRATVDVIDLGDETCLVTYSTDMAPAVLVLALSGGVAEALDHLRDRLESPVTHS
jgi:carbon monoxide dehydrogenase subunit G